jgi:type I restriction enzyme, S subunit
MTDLSGLPAGWHWATLGDISRVVGGSTPKTGEASNWGGDIPWITPDDLSGFTNKHIGRGRRNITTVGFDSCSTQMVPAGTVLFTSRAPIGYVAIAANPVCTNQGFKSFVCGPEADPDYVYWYLKGSADLARGMASGTTFLELSAKAAGRIPIPVPPRAEQREIVGLIEAQVSRVGVATEGVRAAVANLARYRDLILRTAVTGHQRPVSSGRADGMNRVPEHWRWTRLSEIAEIVGGITKDAKREARSGLVDVPYLRVANVQRGYLDLTSVKTVRVTVEEVEALRLRKGDLLFNEGGDRDKLGRGWIWSGEIDPCIHQNHVFRARLRDADLDPRFVSWYANTMGQAFFVSHGRQTTNLASISKTQLSRLPIPVPPIEEQTSIVNEIDRQLSVVDELGREIDITLRRSTALTRAVLTEAFAGRLHEAVA